MKKKLLHSLVVLGLITICFAFISCGSMAQPMHLSDQTIKLEPREYNILGEVTKEGKIIGILGFWISTGGHGRAGHFVYMRGGAGYNDLVKEAKKQYGVSGVIDVINVTVDHSEAWTAFFYGRQTFTMRGIAIQYK